MGLLKLEVSYENGTETGVPQALSSLEKQFMDPIDLIRDRFSQGCSIDTVLHLVMAHFNLSEKEAQAKIDEYFEILEGYDK